MYFLHLCCDWLRQIIAKNWFLVALCGMGTLMHCHKIRRFSIKRFQPGESWSDRGDQLPKNTVLPCYAAVISHKINNITTCYETDITLRFPSEIIVPHDSSVKSRDNNNITTQDWSTSNDYIYGTSTYGVAPGHNARSWARHLTITFALSTCGCRQNYRSLL